jgi:hypothetical protein
MDCETLATVLISTAILLNSILIINLINKTDEMDHRIYELETEEK